MFAGFLAHNEDQRNRGRSTETFGEYVFSPDALEATMENWESEYLQMFFYVILTAFLYQKGSSESKVPGEDDPVDREPSPRNPGAPWPVRRGGWVLKIYENSLAIAFALMFFISFVLHGIGGVSDYNEDRVQAGKMAISTFHYFFTSKFWFESLQNWQSEFLAIASMVILSIFLRQKGSPESKPVDAPCSQTGEE
jgi:hypothetical protein